MCVTKGKVYSMSCLEHEADVGAGETGGSR